MKITFESENKKLLAHLNELSEKITPAAQAAALNSAGTNIRNKAIALARTASGAPTAILKKRIAVPKSRRASQRRLEVLIFGGLWPVKVTKLSPTPRKLKGGAVKYKTTPGTPINPHAFMAKTTRGGNAVWVRKGEARLPVQNVTADISSAVKNAIGGYLSSGDAKSYYERILLSQMDRKVRDALRRKGLRVS